MIDQTRLDLIRRKHGAYASWAVWAPPSGAPKSNMGNLDVLDERTNPSVLAELNPEVVMIGLNLSRFPPDKPFLNFHDPSPVANDFKIRFAFSGTDFWGAYMTDVIKEVVELRSRHLLDHLKLHPELVSHNMENLRGELADLGHPKPVVLAFGGAVYSLLDQNLGPEHYSRLVRITHYSHRISKEEYKKEVHQQIARAQRDLPSQPAAGNGTVASVLHTGPLGRAVPEHFRIELNTDIKAIVEQCPVLQCHVNKGERHRITRSGIRRGSLWVTPRTNCYCVTPTGEVEALLGNFLHTRFGAESGEDYKGRWKWWNITDLRDVSKIIQRLGER